MKKLYKSSFVLVLGIAAFSSVMGQKSSSEYDDVYYIPSDKKTVQSSDKTEAAPSSTVTPQQQQMSDYEKYINSLSNQNPKSKQIPAADITRIPWIMQMIRIMPEAVTPRRMEVPM